MGTPITMPAETPMNTRDTAFGASLLATESAATENAKAMYTGWNMAGIILAISSTLKLVVNIEMRLLTTKMLKTSIIIRLRSNLDINNGMIGPEIAMPIANAETSQPAVDVETLKCVAIFGISPIKPISVFRIPNTPNVRMKIISLCFFNLFTPKIVVISSVRCIISYNNYLMTMSRYT